MLIVFICQPRGKEKVWICSKILTIKEIIKNNANNIFPLLSIISEKKNDTLKISYSDLLQISSKNNCANGYKLCGILDSVKNILCIEESLPCPINDIYYDMGKIIMEILMRIVLLIINIL